MAIAGAAPREKSFHDLPLGWQRVEVNPRFEWDVGAHGPKVPVPPNVGSVVVARQGFEPVRIGPQRRCTFTGYLIPPIASDLFSPHGAGPAKARPPTSIAKIG